MLIEVRTSGAGVHAEGANTWEGIPPFLILSGHRNRAKVPSGYKELSRTPQSALPERFMRRLSFLLFAGIVVTRTAATWFATGAASVPQKLVRGGSPRRVGNPPCTMMILDTSGGGGTLPHIDVNTIRGLLALSGVGVFAPSVRKLLAIIEHSKATAPDDEEDDWILAWEEDWYLGFEEVEVEEEDDDELNMHVHGIDRLLTEEASSEESAAVSRLRVKLSAAVDCEDYGTAARVKRELDHALAVAAAAKVDVHVHGRIDDRLLAGLAHSATVSRLRAELAAAVDCEDYRTAARVKRELDDALAVAAAACRLVGDDV